MATEQQKKGSRIYSGGSAAKTTYQGSAQSGGFNAVKAANSDKAMAEYRRRIVEDGDAKMRELRREQDATTTSLRAQQTADAGMLRLEGQREADALKITQKYDQNTLKQEHTYEEHKMALEKSHLQASGQVAASRIKVADSVIQGVASLSKSYLSFEADRQQKAEVKEQQQSSINSVFGLEGNPDPTPGLEVQAAGNAATVAAETSIQDVDSPVVQQAIRREVSQSTIDGQRARASVYEANADFSTFFTNWTNDTSVVYTRPDGTTFTVATMEGGDTTQVAEAARTAFYRAANVGSMPEAQVASVLVPAVMGVSSSWEKGVAEKIIAGQQSAAVRSATMDITDGLTNGESMSSVFDNGFTALYGSGAFVGDKAGANAATVDTILEFAVANKRQDIINALENMEKIPGNAGTRLGKQYASKFTKARNDIKSAAIAANTLDSNFATATAETVERELMLGLAQAKTPEEEVQLNLAAADKLEATGAPENLLKAQQLRNRREYSPYTVEDMRAQQQQGKRWTQEELQDRVNSGDLTGKDAESLGWDPAGGKSADEARSIKVEEFRSLAKKQANTALKSAIVGADGVGSTDSAEVVRLAIEGEGSAAQESITERLLEDLDLKLQTKSGQEMSNDEIREWMVNRREQIEKEVSYTDGKGFDYEYGRDAYQGTARSLTPDQLRTEDNMRSIAITQEVVLTGRQLDAAKLSIELGKPIPQEIEDRAAALGTNGETLLRAQLQLLGDEYPTLVNPPESIPVASSSDAALAAYDTGEVHGGVALDNLRNSIISKESGGVFTTVNPDSGALGYGQVMPANVASWTTAALGYPVSQREYLRSPDIQMAVINDRFRKMMQQQSALGYTGDILMRRVASIWYSGNAGLYNNTRPQTYGAQSYPSIQSYTMDVVGRYRQG